MGSREPVANDLCYLVDGGIFRLHHFGLGLFNHLAQFTIPIHLNHDIRSSNELPGNIQLGAVPAAANNSEIGKKVIQASPHSHGWPLGKIFDPISNVIVGKDVNCMKINIVRH
jgi:hypothetical protein